MEGANGGANTLFDTVDALFGTVDREGVGNEEGANLLLLPPLWSALHFRPGSKRTSGYSSSLTFSAGGTLSVAATVSTSGICSFSLMSLAMSLTLNFFETLICIAKYRAAAHH